MINFFANFSLPQELRDALTLFGAAGLVIGVTIAFLNWRAGVDRDLIAKLERALANVASLDILRADLAQPTLRDVWRMRIKALVETLECWFGPRRSWSAFGLSLRIAFLYPILLFTVAWAAGARGSIGSLTILPDDLPFWRRAATLAVDVGLAAFLTWWFRNSERLSRRIGAALARAETENSPSASAPRGARLIEYGSLIASIIVVVFGASAVTGSGIGAGVVAVAGAGAAAGISTNAASSAAAVAGGMIFSGPDAVGLSTFFVVLPLANAVFDFLSWLATRWLLERMTRERAGWRGAAWIVAEMLIDLALAALCLAGLAATMAFLLEGMNVFLASRGSPIFDWRAYIEASRALPALDPSNWMTVGMLASTVAPTALHLAAGLSCVATSFFGDGRALAGRIAPDLPEIARQKLAADIYGFQTKRSILFAVLAPIILIALLWLLWSTLGAWLPSLYDLADWSAAFWRR